MPLSRREQADASRARLVEAAHSCFVELGYEATTVAGVLERAGMARGALYHYFPGGKREVFQAVFESVNEKFHRKRDALLELDSPLARIRAGTHLFLQLCLDDEFAQIALFDAPDLIPGQAGRGSTYRLLRAQLDEAAAAGETQALDAEATAMALYGAIRSAGEFVLRTRRNRRRALARALEPLDRMIDALARPAPRRR